MLILSTMETSLYSVRMRASSNGRHIAGAERLVAGEVVSEVIAALTRRAMNAPLGPADTIQCSLERIDPLSVRYAALPNLSTYKVHDCREGRQAANCLLVKAGVKKEIANLAINLLANGAGPGGSVMRGATIMDALTGERLEPDPVRGVRVSRMDLAPTLRRLLKQTLAVAGLDHHRVVEALVLAGKVLQAPGIVAELCWSDAPDYIAGYVASPRSGYQRISVLKTHGDWRGGRVFFVNKTEISLNDLIQYLEHQSIMFTTSGTISTPENWIANDE
jgi:6-carboxyhexanoate--CoA ligase